MLHIFFTYIFLYLCFFSFLSRATFLLPTTLSHSFCSFDIILCVVLHPKISLVPNIMLMSFSLTIFYHILFFNNITFIFRYIYSKLHSCRLSLLQKLESIIAASVVQRYRAGFWYPSSRVQTLPKPSDFSGRKNPQHTSLRKGSKAVCPMSQIYGMKKIPE